MGPMLLRPSRCLRVKWPSIASNAFTRLVAQGPYTCLINLRCTREPVGNTSTFPGRNSPFLQARS